MNALQYPLDTVIEAMGFARSGDDGHGFAGEHAAYERNDLDLCLDGMWATLVSRGCSQSGNVLEPTSTPGPWKLIRDGEAARLIADIPLPDLSEAGVLGGAGAEHLKAAVLWALETAKNERSGAGWRPPPLEVVQGWMPKDALTVCCDGHVCQGEIVHAVDRGWLALRFEILRIIPDDLSENRRRWLSHILVDAQTQYRLVRIHWEPGAAPACYAEVDLTRADHDFLEACLLMRSLTCLRRVVANIVPVATLIADARVWSEALELIPAGFVRFERRYIP
ncbi:MAG TPA: hypothetical protein PKY77_02685 [Phycisphaerae bacterium]|nr:hypothetical protein [Phycisphaerae bacterium]HRY66651.1 hypothetical protein [Phycisphaerae bacterium]HSA27646.1 hypothetical protein [Phycisphaerae bacterium]